MLYDLVSRSPGLLNAQRPIDSPTLLRFFEDVVQKKHIVSYITAHWMFADCGATMHLLLLLVFAAVETHRIFRGFNGRNPTASVLLSLLFVLWLRVVEGRFASRSLLVLLMLLSLQI